MSTRKETPLDARALLAAAFQHEPPVPASVEQQLQELSYLLFESSSLAMKRTKAAAESGDDDRYHQALADWDRALAAIARMQALESTILRGMKFTMGRKPDSKTSWRRMLYEMHKQELKNSGKPLSAGRAWSEIEKMAGKKHPIFKRVDKGGVVRLGQRQGEAHHPRFLQYGKFPRGQGRVWLLALLRGISV